MNCNPFALRERLARLPRFTQRFWTYLTGLPWAQEPPRRPWTANQHLVVFFGVAGFAVGLTAWSTQTLVDIAQGLPF